MSDSPANTSNAHEFTVSEISQAVKRSIEDEFGHVRVRGEVGRISRPGSGHVYFDLKDERSVISAVGWKGVASRWRYQPEQGLEVIATGRLTTFPGQSKYQIVVESIEPAGVGALMALLEERRKKLAGEGLFDEDRKQKLPFLPRVIGVVTSPTGAVIRDILHRLEDRFPTHVVVWPVRVQGESCAREVANAVEGFNMLPPGGPITRPDLIVVARGGGSIEDLWGFNEEIVARAISESELPIISAIGHETDFTLADFAADVRAPTPTGAAEIAVPVRADLLASVDNLGTRQRGALRNLYRSYRDRLRAAGAGLPRPGEILGEARQRFDMASTRLDAALNAALRAKMLAGANVLPRLHSRLLTRRLNEVGQTLEATGRRATLALRGTARRGRIVFDPLAGRLAPAHRRDLEQRRRQLAQSFGLLKSYGYENVLERGFALVKDGGGNLLRTVAALDEAGQVTVQVADGERGATIEADGSGGPVKPAPGGEAGNAEPKNKTKPKNQTKTKTRPDPEDGQESLF